MATIRGTRFDDNDSFNFWWRPKLKGTAENDAIYGYAGNDILIGYGGSDRLYGGSGNDRLIGGGDNGETDYLHGDAGDDFLSGDAGRSFLYGGDGNDRLFAHSDHDYLYGGSGNDELSSGFGNDRLWGGIGSDVLYGGSGHDLITGFGYGTGEYDALWGDTSLDPSGDDLFVLGDSFSIFYTGAGFATIYDFNIYSDKIQLAGSQSDYALVRMNHGGDPRREDTVITLAGRTDYIGVVLDSYLVNFLPITFV